MIKYMIVSNAINLVTVCIMVNLFYTKICQVTYFLFSFKVTLLRIILYCSIIMVAGGRKWKKVVNAYANGGISS